MVRLMDPVLSMSFFCYTNVSEDSCISSMYLISSPNYTLCQLTNNKTYFEIGELTSDGVVDSPDLSSPRWMYPGKVLRNGSSMPYPWTEVSVLMLYFQIHKNHKCLGVPIFRSDLWCVCVPQSLVSIPLSLLWVPGRGKNPGPTIDLSKGPLEINHPTFVRP